jgi:hypothetical protein
MSALRVIGTVLVVILKVLVCLLIPLLYIRTYVLLPLMWAAASVAFALPLHAMGFDEDRTQNAALIFGGLVVAGYLAVGLTKSYATLWGSGSQEAA